MTQKFSLNAFFEEMLCPCDLGVIFFEAESQCLFKELKHEIKISFDTCFSEIKKIVVRNSSHFLKGNVKRVRLRKTLKEVFLYPTDSFYEKISELKISSAFNIGVGITNLPIYSSNASNLIFLYGEAHLNHICAIVSSYNLKDDLNSSPKNRLQQRIIKEVIHELGHFILGPNHCRNKLCVMASSKNLGDIDKKNFYLCNKCEFELEKIFLL